MRSWRRSTGRLNCGFEIGCAIRDGDAYLVIEKDGLVKLRCQHHAGEPVNETQLADWDERMAVQAERAGERASTQPFAPIRELVLDWKQKASGE